MQLEALKPCPFCGGEAEVIFVTGMAFDWWARCTNTECRAQFRLRANTSGNDDPARAKVAELWNRRALPSPEITEAEVEAATVVIRDFLARDLFTLDECREIAVRVLAASLARPADAKAGKEEYDPFPDDDLPIADKAANYVLDELAKLLKLDRWTGEDGSESWTGDVWGSLRNILVEAKVIDEDYNRIRSALEPVAEAKSVALLSVLDAYDAETSKIPLGHENASRGRSTYNWRRSVVQEIRAMLAASPTPPPAKAEPVAWQWRMRAMISGEPGDWTSWSEWREGRHSMSQSDTAEYQERPLYTSPTPPLPDREAIIEQATFLLDRLDDFERELDGDDAYREYSHVAPAKARLRAAIRNLKAGE